MQNKINIEHANPFIGCEKISYSVNDIKRIRSTFECKTENGMIVSLSNKDSAFINCFPTDEPPLYKEGGAVNIIFDKDQNIYFDNAKDQILFDLFSKAKLGSTFIGEVTGVANQGLLVKICNIHCFMPKNQIGYEKESSQSYIGDSLEVKLISIKIKEKEGNRFLPIVSHKVLLDEAITKRNSSKDLQIGAIFHGTVKNISSYGVFVTILPGLDGLIHITDLSWERVSNPEDIVVIGQTLDVVILDVKNNKVGKPRISLGLKQLTQKPWTKFNKNTMVGDTVSGTICNIKDFGVFIMLECGVQGLVHKTELSWDIQIKPHDYQIGQVVHAKIINIDWEKEKLLLSIKQTQQDPWMDIIDKYAVGDIIDTTVTNIKNFGLFVRVDQGIEGLIHVSELSWTDKIQKPQLIYNIGDSIKAIIINIDKDKRSLELSHKRLQMDPLEKHQIGEFVNAIVEETVKKGIHLKLENDDSSAFIPAHSISYGESFSAGTILNCVIKDINTDKRKIILAIL